MADNLRKLLCGKCYVPVEVRDDGHGNHHATCPICGESDTVDRASAEAVEDLTVKMFDRALPPGPRSGGVSVKGGPKRHYRFIFDGGA